jgi:hypothetical protein
VTALVSGGIGTGKSTLLAAVRATLRDRLSTSIICDHPAYVAAAEAAYRAMWHRWCAEQAVPQLRQLRRA